MKEQVRAAIVARRVGRAPRSWKSQVQGFVTRTKDADSAKAIADPGCSITKKIDSLDPRLTTKASNGQDIIDFANGIPGRGTTALARLSGPP